MGMVPEEVGADGLPTHASGEGIEGHPVVSVPQVKVVFSKHAVAVKYVLAVAFSGRRWKVEKTFDEIARFSKGLKGAAASAQLPAQKKMRVRFLRNWESVSCSRVLVERFFTQLTEREGVLNRSAFYTFLDAEDNFYDLTLRQPLPKVIDTTLWCSREDIYENLCLCGVSAVDPAALVLPCDVLLCTRAAVTIAGEGRGIRIYIPTQRKLHPYDMRRCVVEQSMFFGWAVCRPGGAVPDYATAHAFMEHAAATAEAAAANEAVGVLNESSLSLLNMPFGSMRRTSSWFSSMSSLSLSASMSPRSSISSSITMAQHSSSPVGITLTHPGEDASHTLCKSPLAGL